MTRFYPVGWRSSVQITCSGIRSSVIDLIVDGVAVLERGAYRHRRAVTCHHYCPAKSIAAADRWRLEIYRVGPARIFAREYICRTSAIGVVEILVAVDTRSASGLAVCTDDEQAAIAGQIDAPTK